jgi:hypothetical protein
MHAICERNGWGDPFSYARSKEILMAIIMKQKVAETYSGADGYDDEGGAEYKSTIQKNIQGTYNGISVQETWEEQVRYLHRDKIGKYKHHYFARFEQGELVELWVLNANDVLAVLLPKLLKRYETRHQRKDPRLGATVTKKDIYKFGRCLIG